MFDFTLNFHYKENMLGIHIPDFKMNDGTPLRIKTEMINRGGESDD